MRLLDHYIGKQLIIMVFITTVSLLGLDLFFYSINELRFVGKGDYTLIKAIHFVILTIPRKVVILFPWSALIGSLLALGNLAAHSELVVMRSASVSIFRIAISVLKAGVLLAILVFLLSEFVAPKMERMAQSQKTAALSGGQTVHTPHGTWVRKGDEFIHIKAFINKEELQGITRYSLNDRYQLQEVSYAERAILNNKRWILKGVVGTKFDLKNTYGFQKDEIINLEMINEELLKTAGVKYLDRLSISTLWKTIQHRKQNDLNSLDYEIAFWGKMYKPLIIFVMLFIGVPFVFGPLRSSSMGLKIVAGVFLGFVFHHLNALFTPLAIVYSIPPFIAAALPMTFFLIGGVWLIQKLR